MLGKTATFAAAAATATLFAGMSVKPAEAQIRCDGPYQIVNGQSLSTPFCQDNHLADVASNAYGMRVTAREMRWDTHKKEEVCRTIGHDIRVRDACSGFRLEDGFDRRSP